MRANQAVFAARTLCQVLGVSPSGYYAWRDRPPSARDVANVRLLDRMRAIHEFSRHTYGRPRMYAELRDEGWRVNHKRVGRLMALAGLQGASRRKKWRTTKRAKAARPAPDLVDRDFAADRPDKLWVADITYLPTWSGFLYLAVVVDAYSRRVVGWAMAKNLKSQLVLDALNMARLAAEARGRDPSQRPGLPVHVDRLRAQVQGSGRKTLDGLRRRRLRQRAV